MKRYIIPIFIPHYGCRHSCVFCNQHKITSAIEIATAQKIQNIIEEHLCRIDRPRWVEVAFYGGSFTAISKEKQIEFLSVVAPYIKKNKICSIRISTRPDCIDEEILAILASFGVTTVEIGVQSFDDAILYRARRGHSEADVVAAAAMIKRSGMQLGMQLMPGLPGETWQSLMRSTIKTIAQKPDFVRIYPTVILQETVLICHHPSDASKIRGNKSDNTLRWIKKYRLKQVIFKINVILQQGQIVVVYGGQEFIIVKNIHVLA